MTVLAIPSEVVFTTADNFDIFERTWPCKDAKGVVIITHGIAEHSGRYGHVAQALVDAGYTAIGFDLRGHGKSSGMRNYVNSFQDYLSDLREVLNRAKNSYPDLPIFLFGHSMGGGIVTLFAIERNPDVKGILLTGPSVKVSEDISPFLQKISGVLSALLPKLPAVKLDSSDISKDPEVVKAYDEDPLNYRGGILARTASELLNATKIITEHSKVIDHPILIMHGSDDKLAEVVGSEMLFKNVSSEDKTLKIYEGLYHEILNEPEQDEVLADIINWLDNHI